MKVLSLDETVFTSGGHEHGGACDGHDHDHHDQIEHTAPRSYHFDFSEWF